MGQFGRIFVLLCNDERRQFSEQVERVRESLLAALNGWMSCESSQSRLGLTPEPFRKGEAH